MTILNDLKYKRRYKCKRKCKYAYPNANANTNTNANANTNTNSNANTNAKANTNKMQLQTQMLSKFMQGFVWLLKFIYTVKFSIQHLDLNNVLQNMFVIKAIFHNLFCCLRRFLFLKLYPRIIPVQITSNYDIGNSNKSPINSTLSSVKHFFIYKAQLNLTLRERLFL